MHGTTRLDRILSAPPALLLFVLPFAHITALRSIAFVLTVAAAIYVWRKEPGPTVPLKLPLALWAGMALISLLWARNPAYSLGEVRAYVGYDIVYFLAFFALARESGHWNVFRGALAAGLATIASLAVWVYARFGNLNVDGYLGGVLSLSSHLVTVFPLLLVAGFEFRRDRRILTVVILSVVAALVVGYFTFNRMFILAIVACSLIIVATLIRRHISRAPRPRTLVIAAAVFLTAAGAFFVSVAERRAGSGSIDETIQTMVERDSRWKIWKFSVDLIRERPFTGVGFGLFAAEDLYLAGIKAGEGGYTYPHAHNPFLNYAVQMGIGGVAVLLFLLFCLFREFWKLWRSDQTQVSLIGVAGLAMATGVLVNAQANDLWGRHNGYLFWALTGAMLGYARRLLRGAEQQPPIPQGSQTP